MPTLLELQQRFADALFVSDESRDETLERCIVSGEFAPQERLRVYRNNLRENLHKVLALSFPVLQRLAGDAYFRQLTLELLRQAPSRDGDAHRVGASLPAVVAATLAGTRHEYFADIAKLEWAFQQSLLAPDCAASLDLLKTLTHKDDGGESLRVQPDPALRIVGSPWPIFTIWCANRPDSEASDEIDLDSGGQCVVILRRSGATELLPVAPDVAYWLTALADGASVGEAIDTTLAAHPQFDLADALARTRDWPLFAA